MAALKPTQAKQKYDYFFDTIVENTIRNQYNKCEYKKITETVATLFAWKDISFNMSSQDVVFLDTRRKPTIHSATHGLFCRIYYEFWTNYKIRINKKNIMWTGNIQWLLIVDKKTKHWLLLERE